MLSQNTLQASNIIRDKNLYILQTGSNDNNFGPASHNTSSVVSNQEDLKWKPHTVTTIIISVHFHYK